MSPSFKPGEIIPKCGQIELNKGVRMKTVIVRNLGDRPIQVGSHFHFFEVNKFLDFPREAAYGMRLDIPSGTSVRFEPGDEKEVDLIEIGGLKSFKGLNGLSSETVEASLKKAKEKGFRGA